MNVYLYFYIHITRNVVTVSLMFVDFYYFRYTFTRVRIEAYTYKHDQHTAGMAKTRHKSLIGRGGSRFCQKQRPNAHTREKLKIIMTVHRELKFIEIFELIELPAKLLDYLL